jgi:hypothetical protein
MEHYYTEILYWANRSGLCNRIRTLIAYQALAELWKVPLRVCWEPGWACPEELYNLYDSSSLNVVSKERVRQMNHEKTKDRLIVAIRGKGLPNVGWRREALAV